MGLQHVAVDSRPIENPLAPSIEDFVFASLDHKRICDTRGGWLTSVVGVHVDGSTIWVQIAKDDSDDASIVVKMDSFTPADDVLAALSRTPTDSSSRLIVVTADSELEDSGDRL